MTVERDLIEALSDIYVAAALQRLLAEEEQPEPSDEQEEPASD